MSKTGASIFFRILLSFLTATLVICAVLILAAYLFSYRLIQSNTQDDITQQIEGTDANFQALYRDDLEKALWQLTSSGFLDEYLLASDTEKIILRSKLEALFVRTEGNYETIKKITFVDLAGEEKIVVAEKRRVKLYKNMEAPPAAAGSVLFDPSFEASARLFKRLQSMAPGDTDFEGPALDENKKVFLMVGLSKLDVSTGRSAGAILIKVDFEKFFLDVKKQKILGRNVLWVLSPEGQLYLAPVNTHALFDPRHYLSGKPTMKVLNSVSVKEGALVYHDLYGISDKKPILRVAATVPAMLFSENLYPAVEFFLMIFLLAMAATGLVSFLLSNYLSSPIKAVSRAFMGLTHGNLSGRIRNFRASGEIQVLINNFNQMAESLEKTTVSRDSLKKEIDGRKHAQKQTQQSEAKFRGILESAPDAILISDRSGTIMLANPQAKKIFGYTNEEFIGMNIDRLVPERFQADHPQHRADYYANPRTRPLGDGQLLFARRKSGEEVPVEISLSGQHTEEGLMVLCVVRDITGRRHLEQVALQSEKMAAVGQLAGGVAHEINNPLGVILGFSQSLVKRLSPSDPLAMPLLSIEREAIRCKKLVQDLLTFSRAGKTEKEEINLNEAIEGALSLVLAQAKVKNAELIKELEPDLPKIVASKSQLQQIVINLANNAFDAMPKGGTLTVRTKKSQLNGKDAVEIQVQDTGEGIPQEIQSKIFEPFFTTKEVGKGTGLGLSLVYEIIQKHDGQIKLESEVGKGTAFSVQLPLCM